MKAIFCLLTFGSIILVSDALLNWLLGGNSCDKKCAQPPSCVGGACFMNFDGSCNNVNSPGMGMAGMPYGRLCCDSYSDGKWALPKAKSGKELPNPRTLSYKLFPEKPVDDDKCSQLMQQYGQFVAHDMSLTSGVGQMNIHLVSCCHKDKNIMTKILSDCRCAPVLIENCDPVYNPDDTPCFPVTRTLTTHDKKCHSPYSSRTPISDVTCWLDGSMIYATSVDGNKKIRECKGGRLLADKRNGQEWPPQQTDPNGACSFQSKKEPCYMTGDFRANQSPQLTLLHISFFREHNRLCKELLIQNPDWDDEKLFQVARRIIRAILQHITYHHYLPLLIGKPAAKEKGLIYSDCEGFVDDYDCSVDCSIMVEFATAAYRFCHTMVRGDIGLVAEDRQETGSIWLRNSYLQPGILEEKNNSQDLTRGLASQKTSMSDPYFSVDITNYLFSPGNNELGIDLRAVDIQRARDHGMCRYVDVRKACGLPVPKDFCDLKAYGISQENVDKLQQSYECVDDLELAVVGPLEAIEPDARVGPTFLCVIAKQFFNTRVSDRSFYQNGQEYAGLSLDQFKSIQKGASMSRIFCDNFPIQTMQPNAFLQVTTDNPLMPCEQLPSIDLQCWKDFEC